MPHLNQVALNAVIVGHRFLVEKVVVCGAVSGIVTVPYTLAHAVTTVIPVVEFTCVRKGYFNETSDLR